jgi:hypothetical protein
MFESMAIWKLEQKGTPWWKKSWIDYSLWMSKNYLSYIMKVLDRLFTTDGWKSFLSNGYCSAVGIFQ